MLTKDMYTAKMSARNELNVRVNKDIVTKDIVTPMKRENV